MNVSRRALIVALLLVLIAAGVYAGYRVVFPPGKPADVSQVERAVLKTREAQTQAQGAARDLLEARKAWDQREVKAVHDAVLEARVVSGDAVADGLNGQLARFRGGQILPSWDVDP